MNRTVAVLVAVTLGLVAPLAAQHRLDSIIPVRGTPRVKVENVMGEIRVTAWNRAAVRVVAEYDDARVVTELSPGAVTIRSDVPRRGRGGDYEVTYTITVPAGSPVEVSGTMSDVSVRGVCGPVSATVTSGDITVMCATGAVALQSVAGDVDLSDVRDGDVDVATSAGDVSLRNVSGIVRARNASGDIGLSGVDSRDVTAQTVSGDVLFSGAIRDAGRYQLETHSGDVTLTTPGAFNATVSVSTFSGDFETDFPITITPGRQSTRDREFTLGTGSARLVLRSFSGTIHLGRGAAGAGRSDREDEQP